MDKRVWLIVGPICILMGCHSFFPSIPGIFYEFQLAEMPPDTVCIDLGRLLAKKFDLQPLEILQPPPGQCLALLHGQGNFGDVTVSLGSTMNSREIALEVSQRNGLSSHVKPCGQTEDLAARISDAIHQEFPSGQPKLVTRKYGLFAP